MAERPDSCPECGGKIISYSEAGSTVLECSVNEHHWSAYAHEFDGVDHPAL